MKTQISIIKSIAIAMIVAALLVATSMQAAPQTEKSLYERLGSVSAIAAVVDHFSNARAPFTVVVPVTLPADIAPSSPTMYKLSFTVTPSLSPRRKGAISDCFSSRHKGEDSLHVTTL
jgi:hypothetical protein